CLVDAWQMAMALPFGLPVAMTCLTHLWTRVLRGIGQLSFVIRHLRSGRPAHDAFPSFGGIVSGESSNQKGKRVRGTSKLPGRAPLTDVPAPSRWLPCIPLYAVLVNEGWLRKRLRLLCLTHQATPHPRRLFMVSHLDGP